MPDIPPNFYKPFDITYRNVTAKIQECALNLPDPWTANWLQTLTDRFWDERNVWPANPLDTAAQGYREYFSAAARLRWRVLQLAACAYFHISYDLPRVIADEWPSAPKWPAGPDEDTAQDTYFRLDGIFPVVLGRVVRNKTVVGLPSFLLTVVPYDLAEVLSNWLLHLRAVAWIHAGRLRRPRGGPRGYVERKMMEAMTAALLHVQNSRPWTAATLRPPHAAFSSATIAAFGIKNAPWTASALEITLAILAVIMTLLLLRQRRSLGQTSEIIQFLNAFGLRTSEYLDIATADPEGLVAYLRARDPRNR